MAFDLYKETASIAVLTSELYSGDDPTHRALPRNQAICVGLLVRVVKFMTAVMQLVSGTPKRREVVLALNRSILESATNLRYLLLKNDETTFNQFALSGLGPERELYDVIQENIGKRAGEIWPIEARMLKSLDRVCRLAGLAIADVPKKTSWVDLRSQLTALDAEYFYLFIQRIGSHAIHGTWTDLALHHLDESGDGLAPSPEWARVDTRILSPICLLVLDAIRDYIAHYFGHVPETGFLIERSNDLTTRLSKVDQAHEAWLNTRSTPKPAAPG